MWFESIGKRGSNEIASCMFQYNQSIGQIDHIVYYSDSCGGQNRNLPFASMCLFSVDIFQSKELHTIISKSATRRWKEAQCMQQ